MKKKLFGKNKKSANFIQKFIRTVTKRSSGFQKRMLKNKNVGLKNQTWFWKMASTRLRRGLTLIYFTAIGNIYTTDTGFIALLSFIARASGLLVAWLRYDIFQWFIAF